MLKNASLYVLIGLICFLGSCNQGDSGAGRGDGVLVKIEDYTLSRSDVEDAMPKGLSSDDSLSFARNYIQRWVDETLLYEKAQKNIPDIESIDRMVEQYRRELIMFEYQKQLLNEKLVKEISEEDIKAYYDANADKFKLQSGIVKGLFLKVPVQAEQIAQLKKWYRSSSPQAVENIEKYGLKNALIYEFFYDKWVSFDDVMSNIPYVVENETDFLRNHKTLEVTDNGNLYLLNIESYLPAGASAPFDFAKVQIQDILLNQRKKEFVRSIGNELLQEANKKKRIQFYNDNNQLNK